MADYDRAEFTAWLTASCERQGVPVTITDPIVIGHISTLFGVPTTAGRTRSRKNSASQQFPA